MLAEERKEKIKRNAEKLSKMDGIQLLIIKAFQDGVVAGQRVEREKEKLCTQ